MKLYPLLILFVLASGGLFSQSLSDEFAYEQRFRKTGMTVLGTWAVVNIAGGLSLKANTTGSTRYFHEMNAIWNTVNLGIAAFGYFSAARMAAPTDAFDLYKEQVGLDKALLFNAGLDLAYIAGGFWAIERSKNTENNPDRWKGYGQSIILQGAFLFAFDITMVLLHRKIEIVEGMSILLRPGAPDFFAARLIF